MLYSRGNGSNIKRSLVEKPAIQVIFLLEKILRTMKGRVAQLSWGELTFGISTATSTPNFWLSLALTPILFAQLPTRVMSLGGSNATFHFVSSVGRGKG